MVNFIVLAGGFATFIATYVFDSTNGTLTLTDQTTTGPNPSWIASHPSNASILYAVNEKSPQGGLQSFLVNPDGGLALVDTVQVEGAGTTFTNPLSTCEVAAVNFGSPNSALVATDPLNPLIFNKSSPTVNFPVNGGPSNPHQSLEFEDEVFVPDLGADTIWRLIRADGNVPGEFIVHGRINVEKGNGPRHIAVQNGVLFVLHELTSTLTAHSISPPSLSTEITPPLANVSIVPADRPENATFRAAEIVISQATLNFPNPLIYVSNRNLGPDFDPRGDTIAIFEFVGGSGDDSITNSTVGGSPSPTPALAKRSRSHAREFTASTTLAASNSSTDPSLPTTSAIPSAASFKLHSQVFTSLRQIRSFALGPSSVEGSEEFLVAGGSLDGGVAIFKRIDEGRNLELVVKNEDIEARTAFVWI